MRNPAEVCKQILDVVPEEHKPVFEKLLSDFSYKAPEQARECWQGLTVAVNDICGVPLRSPWEVSAVALLMDKPFDATLTQFGRNS